MFTFQETRDQVEIAFTDRHGGLSGGPFASLNLASPHPRTGSGPGSQDPDDGEPVDAPSNLRGNLDLVRRAVAGGRGMRGLVMMRQVHGAEVTVVDDTILDGGRVPTADALVTTLPAVALMVRVADCVPLLLADPAAGVVGAVHAGRPGLVAGVVGRAVHRAGELGATRLSAWVGPHVCGRCYEVPHAMRADVSQAVPEAYASTSWGTPSVDLGAGVRAQLRDAGVAPADTVDASRCTLEAADLYSYRRDGVRSGRLAGLVWRPA